MKIIRIINTDGTYSDLGYATREPPLEMLQQAVGGYIEHIAVTYNGKRYSAYIDEEARIKRIRPPMNFPASRIAGYPILGPMVIDLGKLPCTLKLEPNTH